MGSGFEECSPLMVGKGMVAWALVTVVVGVCNKSSCCISVDEKTVSSQK